MITLIISALLMSASATSQAAVKSFSAEASLAVTSTLARAPIQPERMKSLIRRTPLAIYTAENVSCQGVVVKIGPNRWSNRDWSCEMQEVGFSRIMTISGNAAKQLHNHMIAAGADENNEYSMNTGAVTSYAKKIQCVSTAKGDARCILKTIQK